MNTIPPTTAPALPKKEAAIVNKLRRLLQARSAALAWHHRVGRQVHAYRDLHRKQRGGWFRRLAAELGVKTAWLQKHAQFAGQYTEDEVATLATATYPWGLVQMAACIRDKKTRLAFLREAKAKKWALTTVRTQIAARFPSAHKGKEGHRGGRPVVVPEPADQVLRHLLTVNGRWLKLYRTGWGCDNDVLVQKLTRRPDQPDGLPALLDLFPRAIQQVQEVEQAAQKLVKALRLNMRPFLWCLVLAVSVSGCAFDRADFVTNPDGNSDTSSMSDAGKTTGSVLRNGPHLGLNF